MNPEPTSILAFRNGSIGNTLAAVPALRAIHKRYPKAKLSVVVDRSGHQLLECCPWIDHLVLYEKRGQHRSLWAQAKIIRDLRRLRPSHAVLFKRFFRNGLLAFLSGASVRAGFRTNGEAPFLTHAVPYEEGIPVVDLDLRLAALLDAPSDDRHMEMFLTDRDRQSAHDLTGNTSYVVAHYGGQTTPPDFVPAVRYADLLRLVTGRNRRVVLIGSGAEELRHAKDLTTRFDNAVVATDLPLRVAAALIERADLFIGFNSGPAHIAAAVGTPEIIFFRPDGNTPNELRKWSPVSDVARTVVPPSSSLEEEWKVFATQLADVAMGLSRSLSTADVQ